MKAATVKLAALVVLSGCTGSPRVEPPRVEPAARLVRVEFEVGGHSQFLDVDQPVAESAGASHRAADDSQCLRRYSLHVSRPAAEDLVVCDPCGGSSDALLARCRSIALDALRNSMSAPRKPLDWHFVALAGFFSIEPPVVTADERSAMLSRLAASNETGPLGEALVANASRFEPAELAPYSRHERLAPQLVALVHAAWGGDQVALVEVFRLSLEYHGQLPLFETAARALFPEAANGSLWRKYPAGRAGTAAVLLAELQSSLLHARHLDGGGWTRESAGP